MHFFFADTSDEFGVSKESFQDIDCGGRDEAGNAVSPLRRPQDDPSASLPMPQTDRDISAITGGLQPMALGATISVASTEHPIGRQISLSDRSSFSSRLGEQRERIGEDQEDILPPSRRRNGGFGDYLHDPDDTLSVSGAYGDQLSMTTVPMIRRQTTTVSSDTPSLPSMPPSSLPLTRNDSEETEVATDFSSSANCADISDFDSLQPIERQISSESTAGYHYDDIAPVKSETAPVRYPLSRKPLGRSKSGHSETNRRYTNAGVTLSVTQLHEQSSGENYPSQRAPSVWGGRGKLDQKSATKNGLAERKVFRSTLVPPMPVLQPHSVSETSVTSYTEHSSDDDAADSDGLSPGTSPVLHSSSPSPPLLPANDNGGALSEILANTLSLNPRSPKSRTQVKKLKSETNLTIVFDSSIQAPMLRLPTPTLKKSTDFASGIGAVGESSRRSASPPFGENEAMRQARKAEAAALALMGGIGIGIGCNDETSPNRTVRAPFVILASLCCFS